VIKKVVVDLPKKYHVFQLAKFQFPAYAKRMNQPRSPLLLSFALFFAGLGAAGQFSGIERLRVNLISKGVLL
jgi:hypothetical protein